MLSLTRGKLICPIDFPCFLCHKQSVKAKIPGKSVFWNVHNIFATIRHELFPAGIGVLVLIWRSFVAWQDQTAHPEKERRRPAVMEAASRQLKGKTHLHDKGPTDDMVDCSIIKIICGLIVEVFLVWADGLQQLQHVVWIQSAGLRGHAARQVCVANVCYSLDIGKK